MLLESKLYSYTVQLFVDSCEAKSLRAVNSILRDELWTFIQQHLTLINRLNYWQLQGASWVLLRRNANLNIVLIKFIQQNVNVNYETNIY